MRAKIFADENKKWWTLVAVSFGLFMIMLDNTVVNVALPSIQKSLRSPGLRARVGRRRLRADLRGVHAHRRQARRPASAGAASSSRASSSSPPPLWPAGSQPGANMLIGARVIQGLGAAMMNPATLSIITVTFPPRQRGTAIGIWAGVSALALAIGPLVGGIISEYVNWNWIFFINVPIGLIAIAVRVRVHQRVERHLARAAPGHPGPRQLGDRPVRPQLRADRGEQLRLGRRRGSWSRSRSPPSRSSRSSCSSCISGCRCSTCRCSRTRRSPVRTRVMLLVGLAMFGVFFFVSLYVQQILGYSPTQAGARPSCRGRC